ncbi:MAG: 30S ribosomal protein S15 [candidate division WS6 bacterium OLB20]|uniref:30S ribosomal protein S15 n=1 Tax=candidate division WS6 bacterium OLB20 TaxID=1617426 RepID=A0A136LZI8_9BACT|nr:MAG: 30S ribosomal protein S15 [candidate division WS6 bacterium OLB20]
MALSNEKKQEIIAKFRTSDSDTGSPQVQIALLTAKIDDLAPTLRSTKKTTTHAVVCLEWLDSADGCSPTLSTKKAKRRLKSLKRHLAFLKPDWYY